MDKGAGEEDGTEIRSRGSFCKRPPCAKGAVSQKGTQTQPNVVVVFGRGGATERGSNSAIRCGIADDTQSATTRGIVTGTTFTAGEVVQERQITTLPTPVCEPATSPCTGEAFRLRRDESFLSTEIFREMVGKTGGAGGPPIEKRNWISLCMAPAGGSCYSRKMPVISARGGA